MLVVLREPIVSDLVDICAVNVTSFDKIQINKLEQFGLVVLKTFDGHFSNHSSIGIPLAKFNSYDECMDLFNQLIEAMKSGDQVFDLREIEIPSQLQSADIPHV